MLVISAVVYNVTRFLPTDLRSRLRYRRTLHGARMLANFCLRRGGIFLKAAQYFSTISNLFDAEFTEIFAGVPDRAEPQPYEKVRYRFRAEFNADPEELFLEFDRRPLAAASLGQVHVGRVKDGRKVAVKFLHPNMESLIRRDLRALKYAVALIRWFYGHLDFRGHLNEFSNMIQMEIDYQNEAENMRRVRDNFEDDPRIIVPAVIEELSRSTVLTTEYIEGIPISKIDQLDRYGVDRRALTELLVEAYSRMIFEHRFYHADPHAGNIFVVTSDALHPERLAFVDFGATQMVTETMMDFMQRAIEIMRARDIQALVQLAFDAGMLREDADRETYTNLTELIYARHSSFKLDEHYRINPVRFGRIIKVRDLSGVGLRLRELIAQVKLPRKYIYLGRTLTLLISQAQRLDERVNVFRTARPHVDRYLGLKRRGIAAYLRKRGWSKFLDRLQNPAGLAPEAYGVAGTSQTDRERARLMYSLGQQALFAALGLGFAGLGVWLQLQIGTADFTAGTMIIIGGAGLEVWAERCFYAAGACFAFVLFRMWRSRKPRY